MKNYEIIKIASYKIKKNSKNKNYEISQFQLHIVNMYDRY